MPNHVKNRLTIVGSRADIENLLKTIKGDESNPVIDFNKIIPMPAELHEVTCPTKILTEDEYVNEIIEIEAQRKSKPDRLTGFSHNLTQKMYDEYMEKFGAVNWYDWAIKNWNTKWSAYDQSVSVIQDMPNEKNVILAYVDIEFSTAWSTSFPIVKKLSEMFPTVIITLIYADEDMGYNTGKLSISNGETFEANYPIGGSQEAYKLYFELHDDRELYELVNGKYIYKENL